MAIPAAALCVFGLFALLYAAGMPSAGLFVLRVLGVEPAPFPFFDIHAVLAAAECQRQGIDVYASVPCDAYGRVHVYSPLWLPLVPWGTAATPWVGAVLVLGCILALPLVIRPRSGGEMGVYALALFSPMTLFAFERANNDLVVFLIVVTVGLLLGASHKFRVGAYALIVLAALLKYYPAVLLVLVARERRRDAILCLAGAAAALAVFAACYWDVLGRALANIPTLSYAADSFSAKNLPFGFTENLRLQPAAPFALGLFGLLTFFALARMRRTVKLLAGCDADPGMREMRLAAIGSLLLIGCFFAGQNVNYRGIYFLLVLPALLRLRDPAESASIRRWAAMMIAAVLCVMWHEMLRRAFVDGVLSSPGAFGTRVVALLWILRELLWWWLIAGLAALAYRHVSQLRLARNVRFWIRGNWAAPARKLPNGVPADPPAGG